MTSTNNQSEKKRIIICCDGTWQKDNQDAPTNVALLSQSISAQGDDGVKQVTKYFNGVATDGSWFRKSFNGATGHDLTQKVQEAYKYLVENYNPGDEIFLIGFSRGSFTARTMNGMIYKCGILDHEKTNEANSLDKKIQEAYDFYKNDNRPSSEASQEYRHDFSLEQRPKINLVCFDTVGALGLPKRLAISALFNWRHQFHDISLNKNTEVALHALAIDERRGTFPPTFMTANKNGNTELQQKWFVGNHSSVGGGSENNKDKSFSDIAALWVVKMLKKYTKLGFDYRSINNFFKPNHLANPDSDFFQGGVWKVLSKNEREINSINDLHPSVKKRYKENNGYRPKPLAPFANDLK